MKSSIFSWTFPHSWLHPLVPLKCVERCPGCTIVSTGTCLSCICAFYHKTNLIAFFILKVPPNWKINYNKKIYIMHFNWNINLTQRLYKLIITKISFTFLSHSSSIHFNCLVSNSIPISYNSDVVSIYFRMLNTSMLQIPGANIYISTSIRIECFELRLLTIDWRGARKD